MNNGIENNSDSHFKYLNIYKPKINIKQNQQRQSFNSKFTTAEQSQQSTSPQYPEIPQIQRPILRQNTKLKISEYHDNESCRVKKNNENSNRSNTSSEKQKYINHIITLNRKKVPDQSSEVEILNLRITELQKSHYLMQQKFINSLKILQTDLHRRDERNKVMQKQIIQMRQDLKQRRHDLNILINFLRQNEMNMKTQYIHSNQQNISPARTIGSVQKNKYNQHMKKQKLIISPKTKKNFYFTSTRKNSNLSINQLDCLGDRF